MQEPQGERILYTVAAASGVTIFAVGVSNDPAYWVLPLGLGVALLLSPPLRRGELEGPC